MLQIVSDQTLSVVPEHQEGCRLAWGGSRGDGDSLAAVLSRGGQLLFSELVGRASYSDGLVRMLDVLVRMLDVLSLCVDVRVVG